jgi:hypothetical protein
MRFIVSLLLALVALTVVARGGDDGICPPCTRPEEERLLRDLTEITQAAVIIVTKRNTRNSSAPGIVLEIEIKGDGCRWVRKAAEQLKAIGILVAASPPALELPRLQYSIVKL